MIKRRVRVVRSLAMSLVFVCAVAPSAAAHAAEPVVAFDTAEQRNRYERLLEEYRCLKCQNQNLADSNAALAGDLRREIRERVLDGSSDELIDGYLVSRYGDFVRYRPRFEGITLALWIMPFVLLVIGLATGFLMARRAAERPPVGGDAVSPERAEARRLLDGSAAEEERRSGPVR